MKKTVSRFLLGLFLIVSLFGYSGCKEEMGPIPDGYYIGHGEYSYCEKNHFSHFFFIKKVHSDNHLDIDGYKAEEYVSGSLYYKANIVEKDGKIYFECYKWKDIFGDWRGIETVFEIEYNAENKTIKRITVE